MYPRAHKQAKQAPCRTESTSISKRQSALKTAPHAPRFAISKSTFYLLAKASKHDIIFMKQLVQNRMNGFKTSFANEG